MDVDGKGLGKSSERVRHRIIDVHAAAAAHMEKWVAYVTEKCNKSK